MKKEVKPRKILFVCNGNVFRSMAAKYCMIDYLKKNKINNIIVHSAGITANNKYIDPYVLECLNALGIDASMHKARKIKKSDIINNDLIIAMAQNQCEYIKENLDYPEAVLFNEIVDNEKTSIEDWNIAIKSDDLKSKEAREYIKRTIKRVYDKTPLLYKNLDNYLLFLDFIYGRKDHGNGLPFMPLYESRHSIAFMSHSIPKKEDGHILVIPKKRFSNLDNIPKKELDDLMSVVTRIGKALRKTHQGYNILLNNGRSAGQYIFHSHFHIIPRNNNDCIHIEIWKNRRLTPKEFIEMNKRLKEEIAKV